ncbi:MAG TPA: 4-hydroxy-tetrahydrodipicolinate reductase [Rhodospirillaceae bacterium]|nr:4-hydroxy-tetrahydrodipicolinate reductase [Rhodospirillaceae bacterium]
MIISVGIIGYTGRMGQAIARTVETHSAASLAGGLTRTTPVGGKDNRPFIVTDKPEELFPECDVLIDFSHASATSHYAQIAAQYGKPFLSGTTGLDKDSLAALHEVSAKIPVLYTTNTSLSLVVVKQMARVAARLLKDQDYDVSILDKHHRWKKDAPSGTALTLGKAVLEGNDGKHPPVYSSIRSGAIVGEHDILFAGTGENITIQHVVTDRRVFARGAVQAALWLAGQKPGYYIMDDVLEIGG